MKKIKFEKKLSLKKETIVKFNNSEMIQVMGGVYISGLCTNPLLCTHTVSFHSC